LEHPGQTDATARAADAATDAANAASAAATAASFRLVRPGLDAQIKATRDQIKKLRGIVEAEDPKDVFRRAKQAAGVWIARRDNDAYGKRLDQSKYLKLWSNQRPGSEQRWAWSWPMNPAQAHRFRSEEEARTMVYELLGQAAEGSVDDYFRIIGLAFEHVLGEARERGPFDFLKFPTEAAVLVAKLLELDRDEKPEKRRAIPPYFGAIRGFGRFSL